MFVHLSRELSRAGRLNSEVALIVMDVDRFKTINDTYGHNVGDSALRAIAQDLQQALRPYDLCVRYAGDEFIVVVSDCSREAAEAKRRELQAWLQDRALGQARPRDAAGRQRRRRRLSARRRDLRSVAGGSRRADVSRQDHATRQNYPSSPCRRRRTNRPCGRGSSSSSTATKKKPSLFPKRRKQLTLLQLRFQPTLTVESLESLESVRSPWSRDLVERRLKYISATDRAG